MISFSEETLRFLKLLASKHKDYNGFWIVWEDEIIPPLKVRTNFNIKCLICDNVIKCLELEVPFYIYMHGLEHLKTSKLKAFL